MTDDAMTLVAQQRERLAERARMPWWYWVLFTAATLGLIGNNLLQRWIGVGWESWAALVVALFVYVVLERLVWRARGIRLSSRTLRDYPSARLPGLVFVLIAAVGIVAVTTTVRTAPTIAVVALVVSTAGAVAATAWMHARMRADLRGGRVRP